MQVTIRSKPQEILVNTISLTVNKKDPLNVILFFCYYCGYQIDQIQGSVVRIFPGHEPSEEIAVINRCPRCGRRYIFQTKKFLKDTTPKITLVSEDKKILTFHCFICRTPNLEFNNMIAVQLPQATQVKLPYLLTCLNPQCLKQYNIHEII